MFNPGVELRLRWSRGVGNVLGASELWLKIASRCTVRSSRDETQSIFLLALPNLSGDAVEAQVSSFMSSRELATRTRSR